ncbi:hypothetical protein NL676_001705 [Syzygium grande]|nr:hypothetical protein NL676_001705 [Syzygium grande]
MTYCGRATYAVPEPHPLPLKLTLPPLLLLLLLFFLGIDRERARLCSLHSTAKSSSAARGKPHALYAVSVRVLNCNDGVSLARSLARSTMVVHDRLEWRKVLSGPELVGRFGFACGCVL